MRIQAAIRNSPGTHDATVSTAGSTRSLPIPGKPGGGSALNGGELLMLALATCYCNDLYREANKRGIALQAVEVEASADFDGEGLAASRIAYKARVTTSAAPDVVEALLRETDAVAEIHNTIRAGVPVRRVPWDHDTP